MNHSLGDIMSIKTSRGQIPVMNILLKCEPNIKDSNTAGMVNEKPDQCTHPSDAK